ncbi:hypothetical protein BDN72DRAFT_527803 [Pluteus cervinus]|uniref:Uncharacterized protein n=1 Tax=Pluteus cervinus TaxID=181527 RepID=A0ACD3AZ01_9AGAR|nr:hypothetical protein BDN72DRAFT_527803 [Pluteus cervinus]
MAKSSKGGLLRAVTPKYVFFISIWFFGPEIFVHCQKAADALMNLRRCAGCIFSRSCSRECQLAHWKSGHKRYCQERTDAYGMSTPS